MNPDSITKLTAGLFDGIKNMKSVKNYSYDKSNDLSAKSLMDKKYDNLNQVKMDKSIPIVSDEDSPLYKYPKKEIKEYQDEMEQEYDAAVESVEDEEMEKSKYDLKREIKNPLQDFYNAVIEEHALKRLPLKKQEKMRNRKNKVIGDSFSEEFVYVRKKASKKSDIVGKLYKGNLATIIKSGKHWTKIESGNVKGYIKNEFCVMGTDALEYAEENCQKIAKVKTDGLRIRTKQSTKKGMVMKLYMHIWKED